MPEIRYVPAEEFRRVRELAVPVTARAALFATLCRVNVLYMVAKAGSGHLGTSFSCLDVLSWLHLSELRDGDVCFSSKGHDAPAVYAVLTALGLLDFELIHQLRRRDGLPGHPDVGTPHIPTNTGSLGMGVSKAKGMVHANRLLNRPAAVYVITGDGELQEGQFWESLASAVRHEMGEITAIVDANQIQSDTFVPDVSDLGDLVAKFRAFGWHAARCDGHDFGQLQRTFAEFRAVINRPKVLVADTLKGKGVSFMEPAAMDRAEGLYKFHSGAPSQELYERALPELIGRADDLLRQAGAGPLRTVAVERRFLPTPAQPQRLVRAYSEALVEQAAKVDNLVVLDADLVLDCGLVPFRKRFSGRFFECGIAEQDMVSTAGGMALRGLLPVVHSFACFLTPRANEQIYNNATERTRVIYVGSLAGLIPAGPGHSHQSVRDISILSATPGMELIEPCCESEVGLALEYAVHRSQGSVYLRLVSVPVDVPFRLPAGYRLQPGCGVTLRPGRDAVVVGYGPVLLSEAFAAAEALSAQGGGEVAVVNLPWLNRFDAAWLRELADRYPAVVTLDNHYLTGGQGEMLAARLCGLVRPPAVTRLGLDRIPTCGTNPQALQAHGLDAVSLTEALRAIIPTRG